MSYTYRLHPKAVEDYGDAYTWYEDQQSGLGDRFARAIRLKIEIILLRPETYGSRKKAYRETMIDYFPYLIAYRIDKRSKEIYITSIHHTKRHPRKKYRK
jgi:plasmid stabilization system protein ParE